VPQNETPATNGTASVNNATVLPFSNVSSENASIANATNVSSENASITNATAADTTAARLASDFSACSGIDTAQKESVAYHRILLASSTDGLIFTKLNRTLTDRASVPDIMVDKDGNLRVYFVLLSCKEQGISSQITAVAISYDEGATWVYKKLVIDAPADASFCKQPGGQLPPVDPEVLLMQDGTYNLYATCPKGSMTGSPTTFVFSSDDGISFTGGKATYVPKTGLALDPVVFQVGSSWHLINGNSVQADSQDGISFTETAGMFCPYKFTSGGNQMCYVVGDQLTLSDPTRYRIYLFGDSPAMGVRSVVSTDAKTWSLEQSGSDMILNVGGSYDYYKVAFPTVARLSDGSYLMAYETFIPGTPSSITSGGGQQPPQTPR